MDIDEGGGTAIGCCSCIVNVVERDNMPIRWMLCDLVPGLCLTRSAEALAILGAVRASRLSVVVERRRGVLARVLLDGMDVAEVFGVGVEAPDDGRNAALLLNDGAFGAAALRSARESQLQRITHEGQRA